MSFTVKMSGVIVGRSDLENRDATRRVASGAFRPGLGYDLVQPIFDLLETAAHSVEAMSRYRRSRDALRLQLTDSSGSVLTVRELHIRRHAGSGAPMLEVEIDDPGFWTQSPAT
ncbi:MAG TPA: hypothetical protein VFW03_21895 [Gemmatimonadaceae bacterium]|nr:hypothetical protein [Gemmatimonadaceae bacterium]